MDSDQLLAEAASAKVAGNWELVAEKLGETHALAPDNIDILVQLGSAYGALQRQHDAASAYRAALEIDPQSSDAQLGLAGIAFRSGDYEEALAGVDQVLAKHPDNVDALLLKGRLSFHKGDLGPAEEALRAAVQLSPDYIDLLIVLGDVVYARNSYEQAREIYGTAAQLDPDSSVIQGRLARDFSPDKPKLRRVAEALDRSAPAPTAPAPTAPQSESPSKLLAEAAAAKTEGNWETAVQKLEEALDLAPQDVDILVQLGSAYGALQRLEDARSAFRAALEIDPESPDARLGMARLVSRSGDYQDALASVDEVLARYPDNVDGLLLKGRLSFYEGDLRTAEEALRAAVQLSPDYVDLLIVLGDVLYAGKSYEQAREFYQNAERLDPGSTVVRARLARSFKPDEPQAKRIASKPTQSDPDPEQVKEAEEPSKPKWRVDATFSYSELTPPRDPWREFSGQITHYGDNDLNFHARVENDERNSRHDTFLQVGMDARLSESLSAYLALGGTPHANFRPEWQVLAGGAARLWKGEELIGPSLLTLDTKWSQYSHGDVTTISPGIEQYLFSGVVWFNARVSNTLNETGQWLHGWNVRVNWLPLDYIRLYAGLGEDPETVRNRTYITRAYSVGGVWAISDRTELRLDLLHEDRIDSYIRNSVTLTVTQKF